MKVENGYSYGKNLLIALDQFVFALFGGSCDETLSSYAFRREQAGKGRALRVLIDCFFFFEKEHCRRSFESEKERRHLPEDFR